MTTKQVQATSIKKGSYIVIEDAPCKVSDLQVSRPGKHGHSKIRIEAIGILDDKKRDIVMPGHDNVTVPMLEKKNAQILSVSGNTANVMDLETYEQFDLQIPEELNGQIAEGQTVLYWSIMGQRVLKQLKAGSED